MAKTTSNTSNTSNPLGQQIGVVKIVSGTVTATGADGVARILKVGDVVYLDDVIKTADLSFIQIAFDTGGHFELGRNSEAALDSSVLQGPLLAQGDTGQAPDVEAIQAAIQAGQDPTKITPPPAAGPGAGGPGGDDGHSFVVVNFNDQQGQVNSGFNTSGLSFAAAATLEETAPLITPPPGISIADVTVNEGAGTATFTVTLDAPSTNTVTVNFTTANGTATAGSDYTASNGIVSFVPGVTSQTITVPITNDNVFEGTENFFVNLTAPVNGDIVDAQGVGTIIDNEGQPSLSINDVTVNESAGTATFTVTLSGPSAGPVTVDFATANGSATAGLDYTGQNGTVTFAPGTTTQTITIPILEDTLVEGAETYTVNLINASGATITDNQGLGTIIDNDVAPTPPPVIPPPTGPAVTFGITVTSETDEPGLQAATISEGNTDDNLGTFIITRSGDALTGANTASVLVEISGNTENGAGEDFTTAVIAAIQTGAAAAGVTATDNLNGTVTLTWGSTSMANVSVSLEAVNDITSDSPETLTLTLSALSGATLVNGQTVANLTITEEPPPENIPPVATNNTNTIAEDTITPVTGNVITDNNSGLGVDSDSDGGTLTVTGFVGPAIAHGTLTLNPNGGYSYLLDNTNSAVQALNNGQTLLDTFTYTISDGQGGTASANLDITITGITDLNGALTIGDSREREGTDLEFPVTLSITSGSLNVSDSVRVFLNWADISTDNADTGPRPAFVDLTVTSATAASGTITLSTLLDEIPDGTEQLSVTATSITVNSTPAEGITLDDAIGTIRPVEPVKASAQAAFALGADTTVITDNQDFSALFGKANAFNLLQHNHLSNLLHGDTNILPVDGVLNVADLLTGVGVRSGDLGEYLKFDTQTSPGNTLVSLDTDGAGPVPNTPLVTLHGMVIHDLSALLGHNPEYTP